MAQTTVTLPSRDIILLAEWTPCSMRPEVLTAQASPAWEDSPSMSIGILSQVPQEKQPGLLSLPERSDLTTSRFCTAPVSCLHTYMCIRLTNTLQLILLAVVLVSFYLNAGAQTAVRF